MGVQEAPPPKEATAEAQPVQGEAHTGGISSR